MERSIVKEYIEKAGSMFCMVQDKEYAAAKEAIMAKPKSEFLSAFGIAFQMFKALTDEVLNLGGNDQDIRRVETDEQLRRKIAALIVQAGKPIEKLAENCYKVLVDYGQTLQQMIAAGAYDYANLNITAEHFPMTGDGKREVVVELVHFGRDMESDAILKEFEARGLRPATLPELLAFGATYPEKQREFPILALGSVWQGPDGGRDVACLGDWDAKRGLGLDWDDDRWDVDCRFAAVRKPA